MPYFTPGTRRRIDFAQFARASRHQNGPMRWLALLALLTLALPLGAAADLPDFTVLVRQQAAAVVSIAGAYSTPPVQPDFPIEEPLHELFEQLGRGLGRDFEPLPLGSGFIISSDGYIVTAQHIVEDAPGDEVIVRLADGRELPGRVVGMDRATDIGLVKIAASGLPHVNIGDPALLQPGEWVVTIGTPFGFERSVAAGIVSTTMRAIPSETHIRFIQTDVAMNPGHSGGPLFNLGGEVVGVNSLIFSASGGSIGLSFAVPIDAAMHVVRQLRARGAVTRGRIGVQVQEVTPELAQAFGLPAARGALISAVERQAPAERAGLRAGDVVTRFGGEPVHTHVELLALAAETAPGTSVPIEFLRQGGVQLAAVRVASPEQVRQRRADVGGTDRLGLRLAALPEAQKRRRQLPAALVVERAEGAARRAGIVAGDIILSVNGRPLRGVAAFRASVDKARAGEALALLIERGGSRAFVPLRIP
jgi:serine protease Do